MSRAGVRAVHGLAPQPPVPARPVHARTVHDHLAGRLSPAQRATLVQLTAKLAD